VRVDWTFFFPPAVTTGGATRTSPSLSLVVAFFCPAYQATTRVLSRNEEEETHGAGRAYHGSLHSEDNGLRRLVRS